MGKMRRVVGRELVGLFLLAGLTLALPGMALDPQRRVSQYSHDVWGSEDGLPQNTVLSLAQTRDGYVWLGTLEGLVRFDGARFTVFDNRNSPELRNHVITALAEDNSGVLWVGTEQGLVAYAEGRFERAPGVAAPLENARVAVLQVTKEALWVGTSEGLWQVPLSGGEARQYMKADGLPASSITALAPEGERALWVGTAAGLARLEAGVAIPAPFLSPGSEPRPRVTALHRDSSGVLWMGTLSTLFSWDGVIARRFGMEDGLPDAGVNVLFSDGHNNLWVGTKRAGLVRHTTEGFSTSLPGEGLSGADVLSLLEDRDGHLWVGTYEGLFRVRDGAFTTYGQPEGLSNEGVLSAVLEDRRGTVWLGTVGGGLFRLEEGRIHPVDASEDFPEKVIPALAESPDGTLWVGTRGGLYRYDGQRFHRVLSRTQGLPDELVTGLLADSRGGLWLGTPKGLVRYHAGTLTVYERPQGVTAPVVVIAEAANGDVWFGTEDGLLRWVEQEGFTHYTKQDGLPGHVVLALLADPDGTLWVGTETGLGRWRDDRWARFTIKQGLHDNIVFSIVPDGDGHLWMSSNSGVSRVSRRELEEVANDLRPQVTSVTFDTRDGLRSAEFNGNTQPSGRRGRDGRLWFPTIRGAVVVDPTKVHARQRSPDVRIEEVRVQGRPVVPREGRVELPPGSSRLDIRFTALSVVDAARLPFRYRLVGLDPYDSWMDAVTRTVTYTGLSPGSYRFEVQAKNRDGWWTEPVALEVVLEAPLWLRPTFWAVCVLGMGFVGVGVYWLRNSRPARAATNEQSNTGSPPVPADNLQPRELPLPTIPRPEAPPQSSGSLPGIYKVRILHLSDVHFRSAEGPLPEARVLQVKREAWKRHRVLGEAWSKSLDELSATDQPVDLVCMTGDVADWGLSQEYSAATGFVKELLSHLHLGRDRFFVVPGNHDIQRKTEEGAWRALREAAAEVPAPSLSNWMAGGRAPFGMDSTLRDLVLKRSGAYHEWVAREIGRPELLPTRSPHGCLGYRTRIELPGRPFAIHVIGLDSAWLAGDDHDAGKLRVTEDQVGTLAADNGRLLDGLRLALIHHPLTDLADGAETRRLLAERVDLLLRGHQHEPLPEVWADPERRLLELAAGCLYEGGEGHRYPNAYQLIDIITDERGRPLRYDIRFRGWSPRGGHWFDDASLYGNAPNGRLSIALERVDALTTPEQLKLG